MWLFLLQTINMMWLHQYINITTFNYSTWQSFPYVAWLTNIHDVNHQKRHTQKTYKRALHSSTETCTQRITKEWHKRALHSQKSPTFTNRVTKDVKHLHRRAFPPPVCEGKKKRLNTECVHGALDVHSYKHTFTHTFTYARMRVHKLDFTPRIIHI